MLQPYDLAQLLDALIIDRYTETAKMIIADWPTPILKSAATFIRSLHVLNPKLTIGSDTAAV